MFLGSPRVIGDTKSGPWYQNRAPDALATVVVVATATTTTTTTTTLARAAGTKTKHLIPAPG